MLGYQNKVLRIDLDHKMSTTEPLKLEWAKKYIGGKGLSIRYLYEELKPGIKPLSPENKMVLMTGVLTGTTVPCSGKLAIASKSPATGTILDCSIGGHSASSLKYAGYDAVIIEGKLDSPGYLFIEDEKIEFISAEDLWGKGSHETEHILSARHGRNARILSIGQAGEKLMGIACINSDYYRQAGRGGIGAVMGSKLLKAIVIKGTGGLKINDIRNSIEKLNAILKGDTLLEDNLLMYTDGTPAFLEATQDGGILPRNNFSDATFEEWEKINSEQIKANKQGKKACSSCGLGCGNFTKIGDAACEGPEYETLALGGSNCGISDLRAVVKFNEICDDMGMDTISTGSIIAYAMEMTEKGIHDFGIRFGDVGMYLVYTRLIAKKEGIGAELSMGVKKLSEKYGGTDFAMHTKGLEFPGYEPRGSWGMGLAYAVADRGACHMRAWPAAEEVLSATIDPYTAEGKGKLVYDMQIYNAVKFSLIVCDFWPLDLDRMAEVYEIVTGLKASAADMTAVGERILHLARSFNQREGFDRKNDTVPDRIMKEVLKSGPAAGQKISEQDFNKMLDDYYEALGWNSDGIVPQSIIDQL